MSKTLKEMWYGSREERIDPKKARWMQEFEHHVISHSINHTGKIDWDTAHHLFNTGHKPQEAAKKYHASQPIKETIVSPWIKGIDPEGPYQFHGQRKTSSTHEKVGKKLEKSGYKHFGKGHYEKGEHHVTVYDTGSFRAHYRGVKTGEGHGVKDLRKHISNVEKKHWMTEGVTGPTRMQLQQYFDKTLGSLRSRIYKTEQAFGVYDIQVNSKGDIIHFKETPHHGSSLEVNPYGDYIPTPMHAHSRQYQIVREIFEKAQGTTGQIGGNLSGTDKKKKKDTDKTKKSPNAEKKTKDGAIKLSGDKEKVFDDPQVQSIIYMDTQGAKCR